MGNLAFWQLDARSDEEVLARVGVLVSSSRQLTAELIAHLGEVEERRLHLRAGFGSMFQYCVTHLGLSEDEACRRIDVARLARRFSLLFPALARGELSLSVAALLKPHLSEANQIELLERLSGKSVRQAQECLAELFPQPDVASKIRKLPERAPGLAVAAPSGGAAVVPLAQAITSLAQGITTSRRVGAADDRWLAAGTETPPTAPTTPASGTTTQLAVTATIGDVAGAGVADSPGTGWGAESGASRRDPVFEAAPPAAAGASQGRGQAGRVEPLSLGRYRVQFTASLALKEKLELSVDLMRHANPHGDFAPIVERALDLLLAQLMQRRFGKTRRRKQDSASASLALSTSQADHTLLPPPGTSLALSTSQADHTLLPPPGPTLALSTAQADHCLAPASATSIAPSAERAPPSKSHTRSCPPPRASADVPSSGRARITQTTRRIVSERDGLQCSWVGADGRRCGSRAWLEYDHRHPLGKGGGSESGNIGIMCRPHNRFAAELAYGREQFEQAIRLAKQSRGEHRAVASAHRRAAHPLDLRDSRQPCGPTRTSSPATGVRGGTSSATSSNPPPPAPSRSHEASTAG